MIVMGIDASLRSTGITVSDYDVVENKFFDDQFYIITPHITKKQSQDKNITYIEYEKTTDKTTTLRNYIDELRVLLHRHHPQIVMLEDIPFMKGSRSVVDLALLNGAIRCLCYIEGISVYVVNNMTWKKTLIGNGAADKDFTVMNFCGLNPIFSPYTTKEINDIADSFFICRYLWYIPSTQNNAI